MSRSPRERALGLLALGVLALALVVTAIPGVFTIDEDNYLVNVVALRAGRLTVAGTEGLPPTPELVYFDPGLDERGNLATPVASTAPPLWAPLALPFSFLGWYGLVTINVIALLATAVMAFVLAGRTSRSPRAPYLAAITVLFGGYSIEYAQGLWPHMLSMALVFGAYFLTTRAVEEDAVALAAAAGLLAGLACGVRFPNALSAAALGLGLAAFSRRRARAMLAYAGGLSVPLLAASLINHARLGIWNPLSKGGGYLQPGEAYGARWLDTLRSGIARIIDFSAQAPLAGHAAKVHVYLRPSAETSAYLIDGAVKKAWLQSMPWVALALVALALAWRRRETGTRAFALRTASLVVAATLAVIAGSGSTRLDGLCYNQRYFIDLLPFVALALAATAEELECEPGALAAGAAAAALVLGITLARPTASAFRQLSLSHTPLVLAAVLLVAFALRRRRHGASAVGAALAASLTWALGVHLGDDLVASRERRSQNAERLAQASAVIAAPAAVFTYWGGKDALGPLALDRDVVIIDTWPDGGKAAPALRDELLRRGRRVYVALPVPMPLVQAIGGGHPLVVAGDRPDAGILELRR